MNITRLNLIVVFALIMFSHESAVSEQLSEDIPFSYIPKNGFVPDSSTAVGVGRVILSTIYGKKNIKLQEPLKASLKEEVWTVEGAFSKKIKEGEGKKGGVALIEIAKKTGCILRVSHGK